MCKYWLGMGLVTLAEAAYVVALCTGASHYQAQLPSHHRESTAATDALLAASSGCNCTLLPDPIDVALPGVPTLDTWAGVASMMRGTGWATYNLWVDPWALAQKGMGAMWPAAGAWAPFSGALWGGSLLVVIGVVPWWAYSRTSEGITAAITQVLQVASAAGKLTEGLLVMVGCPAKVAIWGPYATAAVLGLVSMLLAGHGIRGPARVLLAACPLVALWGKASSTVWAAVKPKGRAKLLCSKYEVCVPH